MWVSVCDGVADEKTYHIGAIIILGLRRKNKGK